MRFSEFVRMYGDPEHIKDTDYDNFSGFIGITISGETLDIFARLKDDYIYVRINMKGNDLVFNSVCVDRNSGEMDIRKTYRLARDLGSAKTIGTWGPDMISDIIRKTFE